MLATRGAVQGAGGSRCPGWGRGGSRHRGRRVDIGLALEQQSRHLRGPASSCKVQGCPAVLRALGAEGITWGLEGKQVGREIERKRGRKRETSGGGAKSGGREGEGNGVGREGEKIDGSFCVCERVER